jgi:PAS domain S-box-containing protein
MSAYILSAGGLLSPLEKGFIIINPIAIATILGVLALYQDKSERREFRTREELQLAEESLRQNEKKFRDIFENAEIGMFRSGLDGSQLLDANRKFFEILGGSPEKTIEATSALRWADLGERDEMFRILNRDGRVTNHECGLLDSRGEVHTCLTSWRLDPGQGSLEGSLVDVTVRKKLEAEKLELERRIASAKKIQSLGMLAGGVAHNFNNLLAIILGNAEMLRDTLPAKSDSASFVREIAKAGERSRDLINQLLATGRRRVLEFKPLNLNDVITDCSGMLRKALRENITIEYRLSASPCNVMADPGRIEEILLNLALNAQDAILREGRLTIVTTDVLSEVAFPGRSENTGTVRWIMLTISDTGEGMDQETLTKIFDPFFTTKEPGKGTGLGLSTVYGIVEQHNGRIEVESRQGAGTQFRIYFPWTGVLPQEMGCGERAQPVGGSETILLVEDEEPIRKLFARLLRGQGYTVLEASDGECAIQVFEKHAGTVQLLLTDVIMPQMSGRALHDRLRSRAPAMKVLFMSGYGQNVVESYVAQDHEVQLIKKPFSGQTLAARVREILDAG